MSFTFHERLPEGSRLNIDPGIFHDPDHLKLQASSDWYSFYLLRDNVVNGMIHFHLEEDKASSPYRSPFGSGIFSDAVTENVLAEFISFCENQLSAKGIKSIIIRNQPEIYSYERNVLLASVLNKRGFSVIKEESSAVISINNKLYESGLHKSEKKRLRKCRESALRFEMMPLEQLQKIYFFLKACREEKGYSLSMSLDEINKLAKAFPQRIILTAVIDKNQIAAANISIRVYDHVLYNFYHDHASEYDSVSPVVLLNEGLYQFCQKQGVLFLDLGTSQIEDDLNESLLNFKINLGAKVSPKRTFAKNLA